MLVFVICFVRFHHIIAYHTIFSLHYTILVYNILHYIMISYYVLCYVCLISHVAYVSVYVFCIGICVILYSDLHPKKTLS